MRPILARTSSARVGLGAEKFGHHHARLRVVHFRREAGRVGGARRHGLALARDVVEGIVLAEAHDMPAGRRR